MSRSASGSTSMWFLAPPSACTRLPLAVPGLVDVLGDRRRADEAHGGDVGVLEQAVDGHLVALHDVEAARRAARPRRSSSASSSDADGSFSLGLSTNVLPQARALANIHIGTIAGKLNGVMPATTPSGWRIEYTSTPVDGLLAVAALQQVRDAARRTRCSRGRGPPRRARRDSTLPCSAVSSEAISLRLASTSSRRWNMISARRDEARSPATPADAALADATAASTSATLAKSTLGRLLTRRRVEHHARAPGRARDDRAVDPMGDACLIVDPPRVVIRAPGSPGTGFWGAKSCSSRTILLVEIGFLSETGSVEVVGQAALDVLAVALGADVACRPRRSPRPRLSTVSTLPSISKPSHAEWSMFMWCFSSTPIDVCPFGSHTRMSASDAGRDDRPSAGTSRTCAPAWCSTSRPSARA